MSTNGPALGRGDTSNKYALLSIADRPSRSGLFVAPATQARRIDDGRGPAAPRPQAAFFFARAGRAAFAGASFSSNSSASFSVIAPPSSSASTIVTARR